MNFYLKLFGLITSFLMCDLRQVFVLLFEQRANSKPKTIFSLFLSEKQREFYKNAKRVSKYKKSLKQQNQQNDNSLAIRPVEVCDYTISLAFSPYLSIYIYIYNIFRLKLNKSTVLLYTSDCVLFIYLRYLIFICLC